MTIRVLVVDDSAVMRGVLTELIRTADDMEVVGAAPDAHTAREMIKRLDPDVLTLDVQMPGMDGLAFLERLMRLRPTPVVMVSGLTEAGSETTLRALELGAVDFIGKPRAMTPTSLDEYAEELVDKLRAAKHARLQRLPHGKTATGGGVGHSDESSSRNMGAVRGVGKMIFVGASTGGTEALKEFLLGVPENCPPILVVQHMPETFTASFAKRLDTLVRPQVIEAQGGERVAPGMVYIAPGHSHLRIKKAAAGYVTELLQTPAVNRHRPSVDVLFDSAAELVGKNAIGVILTGMGKDGAQGLLRMRQAGARTFGQDEESCVVYGMPREAFMIGAVAEQLPLEDIAPRLLQALGRA